MVTLCVCTHNPRREVLEICLRALREQILGAIPAELVVVDNASRPALTPATLGLAGFPFPARVVPEPEPGLMPARLCGLREARGSVLVYVDDDNELAADYVGEVARFLADHPRAGAVGGVIVAAGAAERPAWFREVEGMLAVRDLGPEARCLSNEGWIVPCGAGLVVRTEAMRQAARTPFLLQGRKGKGLASGEDSELCLRVRHLGWELWHAPRLRLHHHLPSSRFEPAYLERLAYRLGRSEPYLDLYRVPTGRGRRIFFLRRGIAEARYAARRRWGRRGPGEERTEAPPGIFAALHWGKAVSYWGLALRGAGDDPLAALR